MRFAGGVATEETAMSIHIDFGDPPGQVLLHVVRREKRLREYNDKRAERIPRDATFINDLPVLFEMNPARSGV